MSKIAFTLRLSEEEIRKKQPPPTKKFKDKTKYSRKNKHKAQEKSPEGAFFCRLRWGLW